MRFGSIKSDTNKEINKSYVEELLKMSDKELIKEFLSYLDYTEETDSGNIFHPIQISCVRILLHDTLSSVLEEMRKRV